jgi:sRNA-binding protein
MTYREEAEYAIKVLVEQYPRTFFPDPHSRLPLKRNLATDLERDGCPLTPQQISAGLDWYQHHFAYQYKLRAGSKRIDLNGKEIGSVTEAEQRAAISYVTKRKQEMREGQSIESTAALVRARRLPDDAMRKIDAPPDPLAQLQKHIKNLRRISEPRALVVVLMDEAELIMHELVDNQ